MSVISKHAAICIAAALGFALAGCADSESISEPAASKDSLASSQGAMVFAHGDFVHHFETIEDMAKVDVVIAKVVAERDGVVPHVNGEHQTSELRRIITVDVSDVLAGSALPQRFDIQTLGWVVKDGQRTPLTFDGMPWLDVGDQALIALDDPNGLGEPGFASESAVQVFENDRIAPAPRERGGTPSRLSTIFDGMSRSEVVQAFESLR